MLLFLVFCLFSQPSLAQIKKIHPNAKSPYVEVLMWHDVIKPIHGNEKEVWFDTTVEELKAQFAIIKRNRINVVSLAQLYKHLSEGTPLPPRPMVLTFDDNNLGLYKNAFPLLKQYRYPATLFVHTNFVGVTTSKDHCSWSQLKEMQKSGLVTIQGHTCSHPADLRALPNPEINKELRDSKKLMEEHMNETVIAFAYPEGKYDDKTAKMTSEAGYKMAFTEDWGSAGASRNMMLLHRYSIHKRFNQAIKDLVEAY